MNPIQPHFAMRGDDGIKRLWLTERLWQHAAKLESKQIPIEQISALDINTWFFNVEPTCRRITEHTKRINDASFEYPVILSAEGWVMDGMHRICKALLIGKETIEAVQFLVNPEADEHSESKP
jgi:hypothetical protein